MSNSLHNFFSGNQNMPLRTHGSVEDLIRNVLGNRFIDKKVEEEEPIIEVASLKPAEIDKPKKSEPKKESKPEDEPQLIEEFCDGCDSPLSACSCQIDSGDSVVIPIDLSDEDSYYEEDEGEEELTPFQKITQQIKRKSDFEPDREEYLNTDGIGTKKKEKVPVKPISKHYTFYRDVDEVFECKVTIEGTMSTASARMILNCDTWNLVFYGKIRRDGTCLIPIKKLSVLPSGTTGRASLEVIVDDVVFYPWENAFRVEESRKVKVQIKGKSNK
jgi:hypothetical protein